MVKTRAQHASDHDTPDQAKLLEEFIVHLGTIGSVFHQSMPECNKSAALRVVRVAKERGLTLSEAHNVVKQLDEAHITRWVLAHPNILTAATFLLDNLSCIGMINSNSGLDAEINHNTIVYREFVNELATVLLNDLSIKGGASPVGN